MHVTLLKFTHLANIEVEKANTLKQVETVVQTPDLLFSLGMDKCTCKNEGIAQFMLNGSLVHLKYRSI